MRASSPLLLATISFSINLTAASIDLDRCVALPREERIACVETQLTDGTVRSKDIAALDPLIELEPVSALELSFAILGRVRGDAALHASLLDRQVAALEALGRLDEAAARAREALRRSSGTRTLEWRSSDGGVVWTAALDNPTERDVNFARLLLATDQEEQARARIEGALRMGAGDDARRLWGELRGGAVPGLDATPAPIEAGPWFPRLPPVAVELTDGGSLALAEFRGKVLILDFWASWCEPCLKELPELGRLYESEQARGLEVILVNMGESPHHAERFARGLGLEMPVGVYDSELEAAFDARSLPTVIVADRDGRVRARFDGYREGLEAEIAELARSLLPPGSDEVGVPVGEVLLGAGLLEVEWARNVAGGIEGLAVASIDGPDAAPRVVAVAGRYALVYDWRGAVVSFVARPPGAGALRRGDIDGDGTDELFSFRAGGRHLSRLDLNEGAHRSWDSPAPMLDLALVPAAGESEGAIVIATVGGLHRVGADFSMQPVPGFTDPTGLAPFLDPQRPRLGVLSRERGLCRVDLAEPESASCADSREGERLVPGRPGGGIGTVPQGVMGVVGRFLDGPEGEVALLTSSGQLVILDAASGAERFRARLDRPRAIAAGDIDRDGRDELALAVGNRLLLLKHRAAEPASGSNDPEHQQEPHEE